MILYKYRPIDDNTRDIFTVNELYFSDPKAFNDPFDCHIPLSFEGSKDEWIKYLYEQTKIRYPKMSPGDRLQLAQRWYHSPTRKDMDPYQFIAAGQDLGIYCLSKINSNILMWSHYSSNHKGICLGFSASDDNRFFGRALEVKYSPVFPTTRVVDSYLDRMTAMVLTKSNDWHYEEEWRIIEHSSGPGIQKFDAIDLREIIFGCRTEQHDIDKVIKWVKDGKSKPVFYKAEIRKGEFAVDIQTI